MAGMTTGNSDHLIRSELWSTQLKDVLYADLMARGYVRWLTDFPDGTTFNIPSIGTLEATDYTEDSAVQYDAIDTGNFQFSINNYVQSGTYITNKDKQDMFYMNELVSTFVPKMGRAISERLERDIFKEGQPVSAGTSGYQTASDTNDINGYAHRWVGSSTLNSVQTLSPADFARANLSLDKCFVPRTNRIAIVDPSVAYSLETLTNLVNVSDNPMWQGIITTGLSTGMRFVRNIYGFDVYVSNFLAKCGEDQDGSAETIDSVSTQANAVCNLFFSATSDLLPFVGAWRQEPKVESDYNKDYQREEYVTTARYGLKIYRPENFVTVLSDTAVV